MHVVGLLCGLRLDIIVVTASLLYLENPCRKLIGHDQTCVNAIVRAHPVPLDKTCFVVL